MSLAVMLSGCGDGKAPTQAGVTPEVNVAAVVTRPVKEWEEFNGRIGAVENAEIRSRVGGYVERVAFREGDQVRRGDLLFAIDPRPYRATLDAALAQAERARAEAQLAKAQEVRANALLEEAAGSREEAETKSANYAQRLAELKAAQAAVASAKLNMQFTEVRAPVSGIAGRALQTVGNLVVADQTLLTSVVSQDPVYVEFDLDEHTYMRYHAQDAATRRRSASNVRIGLAGEDGFPHAARIEFVNNRVDAQSGTIHMRALLSNPDRVFTPGLYARVQFASTADRQSVLIDDKAVMTDQNKRYVYVLGPDNKALRKDVTLGRLDSGLRAIESGLSADDKVIVDGLQRVFFSGAPVKPKIVQMDASQASATASGAKEEGAK